MKKVESSAEKWIQRGRRVWVKSPDLYTNKFDDAFLQGQIVDIQNNKQCRVLLTQSKHQLTIPIQNILKLTYGNRNVADMVDLQQFNQPQLLFNIKRRYLQDSIFTYCGPTLLIINPYTKIQRLFNDSVLQQYQAHVFSDTLQYKTLSPHIFALAAFCLWQLFDNERNQSIVISGQSGAGKTQNTKYCLKFLASLGKNMKQLINDNLNKKSKMNNNLRAAEKAVKKTSSKVFGIEEKILGCNQILQAFGNSKTIRNDNSSRFGKLILLVYGQTQIEIKSAFIISYLLQKSRIVSVSQGERNYHIFYYLIKGTTKEQKSIYMLKDNISYYHYLNQSSVESIVGVSDEEKFRQIKKEFQLYLDEMEVDAVMRILAVVLNLGNVMFERREVTNAGETAVVVNSEQLQIISKLLLVPVTDLSHCLQFKTRKLGLNIMNSPLRYDQAISLRDSFAKNIYQKTFNFLIKKMNEKIEIEQITIDQQKSLFRKSIGLLDIFGFEVLNNNSLEQFFINFANQKLQQLYVSYIFKQQQNQFMRQGLRQFSHDIGFQDNKPIIDLFEKYPLGIFHLVNQSSELNQDDKDLPSSIQKNHNKNTFLKIPKTKKSVFEILHSCSPVSYNTSGFTIKNKDEFPQQLIQVIKKSQSNNILKICCIGDQTKQEKMEQKTGKSSAKKFLGSKFLNSINTLIEELYSCDCHFVRCIKPNFRKSPKLFHSQSVLQSLRYLGVLDSIIIRKLGYIYRRPFKQFYKKFYQLDNYIYSFHQDVNKIKTEDDFKKECQKIIHKYLFKEFRDNDILLGHKKILIKQSTLNHLQLLTKEKRKLRISVTNRFKTMYKNAVFRTKVKVFLSSIKVLKVHMKLLAGDIKEKILNTKVIKIQNIIKKFLWQKRLQKIKQQATKSVTRISAYFKMKQQRKIYLRTKQQIRQIQSNVRLYLTMGKIMRQRQCRRWVMGIFEGCWETIQKKKAMLIQKVWKGYLVRKMFKQAIEGMKRNIRLSKIKGKFKRALFVHKYNKFRQSLARYRNPIIRLQAIVRGKFLHRVYTSVKKSTLMIQRAYRRHLKKKFYLWRQWQLTREVVMIVNEKGKQKDMLRMGIRRRGENDEDIEGREVDETQGLVRRLGPGEMARRYRSGVGEAEVPLPTTGKHFGGSKINQSVESGQKNTLQLYLLDYDTQLDYSRNPSSILQPFQKLKIDLKSTGEYLIYCQLTQTHLIVVSNKQKIYAIRLSDYFVLEQSVGFTIQQIYCALEDVIVVPYEQGRVYQWGLVGGTNDGKKNVVNKQTQCKSSPTRLKQYTVKSSIIPFNLKKQPLLCYGSKGHTKLTISSSKIYFHHSLFGQSHTEISTLPFKLSVVDVAVSYHFMHILTTAGTIYSKGKNMRGELGLGGVSDEVKSLELNNELIRQKEFIETISVGMGHTVAKSRLGYVYFWGDNSFSQLSSLTPPQSQYSYISIPTKVQFEDKPLKVIQSIAGFRTSYFLNDNLKILVCGTSLIINNQNTIMQITLLQVKQDTNHKGKYINPIKMKSIWNLQYSLLVVNAIDFSKCKQGSKPDAILKYAKLLAKQWLSDTLYPPYHQFIDNCLNLSDLRKLKFKQKTQTKVQNDKKKTDKLTKLQELKMILQLRKTSSLFKQAAKSKIDEFLSSLDQKHRDKWTDQQRELFDIIMNDIKKNSL